MIARNETKKKKKAETRILSQNYNNDGRSKLT